MMIKWFHGDSLFHDYSDDWSEYFKIHKDLQAEFILTDLRLFDVCKKFDGFTSDDIRNNLTLGFSADDMRSEKFKGEFEPLIEK